MKKLIFVTILFSLSFSAMGQCSGRERNFQAVDPVDQSSWIIRTKEYLPSKKSVPVIFVLPPIVGETVLDRRVASKFCASGMASYIIQVIRENSPEREIRDWRVHDESYERALAGVSQLINVFQNDDRFNGKFGILGMSLGGMLASFVAGSEARITASVIVAGAGNVAGVLTDSDQEIVVQQRNARMAFFDLPDEQAYFLRLKSLVTLDPILVASNIAPRSMYLFIANSDTTVPTQYQKELRQAVPEPLVFVMNASHTSGLIKAATLHAKKMTSFFSRRLKD
jgi:dienelactone hydrolase